MSIQSACRGRFQSTHPTRGATDTPPNHPFQFCGFNPRTPHGVRRRALHLRYRQRTVSIHAPHTGCDSMTVCRHAVRAVSIHAPHTGCDAAVEYADALIKVSIHAPHTGCDNISAVIEFIGICFNPRTPHGVRLFLTTFCSFTTCFNPRTPHGVRLFLAPPLNPLQFQSTHPTRGATRPRQVVRSQYVVSIHAPHTGCDGSFFRWYRPLCGFNPRTPHGVRPATDGSTPDGTVFQSTHPTRGAT